MAEDEGRDDGATDSKVDGAGGGQGKSLDDLKAKLGIARRSAAPKAADPAAPTAGGAPSAGGAPAPAAPVDRPPTASDFSFSLNQPVNAGQMQAMEDPGEQVEFKKSIDWKHIGVLVGGAVLVLVVGLFLGKAMRERVIENFKTKEAKYLLDYFTTTKASGSEETVLSLVESFADDAVTVANLLAKATDDNARIKAEEELEKFLKRTQEFRTKNAMFTYDGAFPGVIFNNELAAGVVQFIDAVQRLNEEVFFLSLEADTWDRVGGLEEKGEPVMNTFFVEPGEKDGKKALTFKWIAKMREDASQEGEKGEEVLTLLLGTAKPFWAPVSSMVQFDIGPFAKRKGEVYKNAIMLRVRGRIAILKQAAEAIAFVSIKDKMQKLGNREMFFTIF